MSGPAEAAAPSPAPPPAPTEATGTAERPSFSRALLDAILQGSSWVVTTLSVVTAMVIGGLIIAFTNTAVLHAWGRFFSAPGSALAQTWDAAAGAYVALFEGAVFNPHTVSALFQQKSLAIAFSDGTVSAVFNPLSETAVQATPLILAGLAVALAFQAGLFNIGATSQFIGGAMLATWLGFAVSLPPVLHAVVCVLGGFAGGAVTGWVVGFLKATTGAHEVIVTIMLNYVMEYLLSYLLGTPVLQKPGRSDLVSPLIASDAHLPLLAGSHLRVNAGFLVALACAAGVAWLLNRSTTGFEFRSVGANPNAARSAGMSVSRTWNLAMLLAGGLAGLAASTVIQGTDFQLTFQSYGTYGIVAITVALLGRARPLGVVLAALLYGALDAGAPLMQISTSPPVPVDIVAVIQALIVMFVAAPALVRVIYRLRTTRAGGTGQVLSKGWNA
ncbi:MAG TPA: ABC transporter permease [Streptosporangiaceae bacterium]|nr:ABC transporter permease [Streptosporangiaceae bacterium]